MANLKTILRTCIFCRKKLEQKELLRFKCSNKQLSIYDNIGRSFYICKPCKVDFLDMKDIKKKKKALCRECKNKDKDVIQLEEILLDVR